MKDKIIYPPPPSDDEETDMYWDTGEYLEDGHPALYNEGSFD